MTDINSGMVTPPKQTPTLGRIVHWFPMPASFPGEKYAAIVIEGDDTYPTLSVFRVTGIEVKKSVPPAGFPTTEEYGHWEWPQMK